MPENGSVAWASNTLLEFLRVVDGVNDCILLSVQGRETARIRVLCQKKKMGKAHSAKL